MHRQCEDMCLYTMCVLSLASDIRTHQTPGLCFFPLVSLFPFVSVCLWSRFITYTCNILPIKVACKLSFDYNLLYLNCRLVTPYFCSFLPSLLSVSLRWVQEKQLDFAEVLFYWPLSWGDWSVTVDVRNKTNDDKWIMAYWNRTKPSLMIL